MTSPSLKTTSPEACSQEPKGEPSPEPYVSIVTPVYNGGKYIRECIESVLEQSYTNWEYIISDNCSTDETVAIAEEYAQKDSRIKVVKNTTCLAIMPNWNRALRLMSPESEFCKVVHADDILYSTCVAKMVSVAQKDDRIGIVGAYRLLGDKKESGWLPVPDEVFSGKDVCRQCLLWKPDVFGSPSNILLRSDLVRNRDPFYPEDDIHADTTVCFDLLREYDFGYVHEVLTYTRHHQESVTSRVTVLNTHQAAKYWRLVKFGPEFLQPEEYDQRYKALKQRYYKVLVSRYLLKVFVKAERGSRKEFVAYHKQTLEDLGETLDVRCVFRALIELVRKHASSRRS